VQPTRWVDILPEGADHRYIEKARHMDDLEARFPFRGPMAGETEEEWVMRETAPLRDPDWKCANCTYSVSLDGEEPGRTKWCPDCAEERKMYEDEEREWLCNEAPSVSCLTEEWT